MRFRVTLQTLTEVEVVGAPSISLWADTDYWYEVSIPGHQTPAQIQACAEYSGHGGMLTFAASHDASLYPNDGFRFVWKAFDEKSETDKERDAARVAVGSGIIN